MSARGKSPDADPVGIEIVLGGIGAKPADGSLAIFNLRWERCGASKAVIDARYGVTIGHKANSRTSLFSAPTPASSMKPNDYRHRAGKLLWTIEVEREHFTLDMFVDHVSLERTSRDLH